MDFLYEKTQNLHKLFTQFADNHIDDMGLFSSTRKALIRLPSTSGKLLWALDMFYMAKKCV